MCPVSFRHISHLLIRLIHVSVCSLWSTSSVFHFLYTLVSLLHYPSYLKEIVYIIITNFLNIPSAFTICSSLPFYALSSQHAPVIYANISKISRDSDYLLSIHSRHTQNIRLMSTNHLFFRVHAVSQPNILLLTQRLPWYTSMVMKKDGIRSVQFMKPKLIALVDTFFFLGLSSFSNPTAKICRKSI